jgi:hypothetical protein
MGTAPSLQASFHLRANLQEPRRHREITYSRLFLTNRHAPHETSPGVFDLVEEVGNLEGIGMRGFHVGEFLHLALARYRARAYALP